MDRIDGVPIPKALGLAIPGPAAPALLGLISGIAAVVIFSALLASDYRRPGFLLELAVLPGLPMGLAVMLPFRGLIGSWWPRTLLAIGTGGLSHASGLVMGLLAASAAGGGINGPGVFAAAMGAALVFSVGMRAILGRSARPKVLLAMVAGGSAVGLLVALAIDLGLLRGILSHLALSIYPAWGVAVAGPLGALLRKLKGERSVACLQDLPT